MNIQSAGKKLHIMPMGKEGQAVSDIRLELVV